MPPLSIPPAQTADEIRAAQLEQVALLSTVSADLNLRHEARRRAERIIDRVAPLPIGGVNGDAGWDHPDPRLARGTPEWIANRRFRAQLWLSLFDRIYLKLTGRRSGAAEPALVEWRAAA